MLVLGESKRMEFARGPYFFLVVEALIVVFEDWLAFDQLLHVF